MQKTAQSVGVKCCKVISRIGILEVIPSISRQQSDVVYVSGGESNTPHNLRHVGQGPLSEK